MTPTELVVNGSLHIFHVAGEVAEQLLIANGINYSKI